MKNRKLFLILLALVVMILMIPTAASAADSATAKAEMKGSTEITATVTDSTGSYTGTAKWVKNSTVDCTVKSPAGDYVVAVVTNGSGVKSASIKSAPAVGAPVPAVAAPAAPNNNGNNGNGNNGNGSAGKTDIGNSFDNNINGTAYYSVDNDNPQFHCNTFGGNGRVWPSPLGNMALTQKNKQSKSLKFDRYDKETWMLVNPNGGAPTDYNKKDSNYHFICPECGSDQWITFSNQSGVPDGKNIQMQHPTVGIEIVKKWIDAEGNTIRDTKGLSARFTFEYKYYNSKGTGKSGTMTVGPGTIKVPAGTYTIKELDITNFTLVQILDELGFVIDLDKRTATIEITTGMARAGGKYSVAFTNQSQLGELNVEKRITVDGEDLHLGQWLEANYPNLEGIIAGMKFGLYKVAAEGDAVSSSNFVRFGTYDYVSGLIAFGQVAPGWYAVTEEFTGAAAGVFKAPPVWYVMVTPGGNHTVSIKGHYEEGTAGGGFDYDANYTLTYSLTGYVLGYPGLNASGDVFPIQVTNTETGVAYPSFCANAGSTNFDETPGAYMVAVAFEDALINNRTLANGVEYLDFVKAYNYIEANHGNLNDLRPVTQIITWYLLGAIEVPSAAFDNINWGVIESGAGTIAGVPGAKGIVEDVVANYKTFAGKNTIIDIAYMVSNLNPNFITAQPQLVPIYDSGYIINIPKEPDLGSLEFEKKVGDDELNLVAWLKDVLEYTDAEVAAILSGLEFTLTNKDDSSIVYTAHPDGNGIVSFTNIIPGTYILTEQLINSAAASVFNAMDPIEINIGEGPNSFTVLGATISGNIAGPAINDGDLFEIINGFGWHSYDPLNNGLGYASGELNNDGDLFYIGVRNLTAPNEGAEFDSFCAYAGAKSFSSSGYMIAHSMNDPDYLSAFNYIVDNYYGDGFGTFADSGLADQSFARKVAQTVVWYLLGAINIDSPGYWDGVKLSLDEIAAVEATIASYPGYVGSGTVIDVVYMSSTFNPDDPENNQPQIVPIFGTFFVKNEPKNDPSDVEFDKTKFGGELPVGAGEFEFDLFKIVNGNEEKVGTFATDSNGKVKATGLASGNYVFREVFKTYAIPGVDDYALIWAPLYPGGEEVDGLYFEITSSGAVIWANFDGDGIPVVDNTFWDKNFKLWRPESDRAGATGQGTIGETIGGGFIFFPGGNITSEYVNYSVTPPNCTQGGVINFTYGPLAEQLMAIGFAPPLGHDWELNTMGDGLRCTRCIFDYGWWDLTEDLLAIYHSLGGLGGLTPSAPLSAPVGLNIELPDMIEPDDVVVDDDDDEEESL